MKKFDTIQILIPAISFLLIVVNLFIFRIEYVTMFIGGPGLVAGYASFIISVPKALETNLSYRLAVFLPPVMIFTVILLGAINT